MIDKYTTAIKQCKQLGNEVPEALTALLKDGDSVGLPPSPGSHPTNSETARRGGDPQ
jgi:hypothetical protein